MSKLTFEHGLATSRLTDEGEKFLLKSGFKSDFTVRCQDREWKVHQEILQDRSDFFHTMLGSGQWKENEESCIEMTEDQPEVIQCVLEYIYGIRWEIPELTIEEQRDFCLRAGAAAPTTILFNKKKKIWRELNGSETKVNCKIDSFGLHDVTFSLCFCVLLIAAAERLLVMMDRQTDVSALAKQAKGAYISHNDSKSQVSLVTVLDLALQTLSPSNDLRRDLVELCILNHETIEEYNPAIEELLQKHEAVTWDHGRRLYKRLRRQG